jgi:hypothetical protein
VLRLGAAGGSFAPFAELGVGFYLVEDATGFDARDASTGARDSALTLKVSDTQPAPGFGLALGADWFPNGGRLGFGIAGRIRAAGLPIEDHDDSFGDAIFAALQARVILR